MSSATATPDQKLIASYQSKFEMAAAARQQFEREWYTNLAFFFGKQYAEWQKTVSGQQLVVNKAPAWRVRLVSNRIKPIVRKEIAKINQERAQFYVLPQTPDDEDITKARMAEAVGEHLLYSQPFNQHKREAIWWASLTGSGFMKTGMEGEDIKFFSPSPFHIWVPNLEQPLLQEQTWVCHGISMSPDEVEERFGKQLQADSLAEAPETKFLNAIGLNTQAKGKDSVFVKEFWIKPNGDFPDGAMFITAGNELLHMEEGIPELELDPVTSEPLTDPETNDPIVKEKMPTNLLGSTAKPTSQFPYEHGRYPFSKITHIPTGRFYGESVIVDLISLQKEYNRSRSQVVEARNLTSKPQWAVQKGSIDVRKLTAQPGLVIQYAPGFEPPKPVQNPEIPSYVFQDQSQTLADIDYISNQHEISQGRTPPGVEAASAIAFLQEESDSVLSYTIDSLEECVEDIGYQSILLAKQYWPADKLLKIISGNQVYEVTQFKQNSLPDQLDFRVEKGSMSPRSKAAKQAFIMELVNSGMIPPMEGLKHLEQTTTNRLYEDMQIDSRQAERENYKMQQPVQVPTDPNTGQPILDPETGQPVPPAGLPINEFDNDEIHILTHGRFMKTQKFEYLEEAQKQTILMHYQMHLVRIGRVEVNGSESTNGESGDGTSGSSTGSDSGVPVGS